MVRVRDWLEDDRMGEDTKALVRGFLDDVARQPPLTNEHGYAEEVVRSLLRHARVWAASSALKSSDIERALAELNAWADFGNTESKQLMTYADIAAMPEEEDPWLVEGLIKRKGINLVYGKPEAGKTWLLLDMVQAVASGGVFLERETRQCSVLYIDEDVGVAQVRQRAPKLAQGRKIDWATLPVTNRFNHGVRLTDESWVRRLIRDINDNGVGLLVLETARSLFDGDENSSADVSKLFRSLKLIRDETDVTIVLSHHTPREGDDYRGSGVFGADIDTSLSVKGGNGAFTVMLTKSRWKKRDDRPTHVRLVDVEDDAVTLRVVRGGGDEPRANTRNPKQQAACEFIIDLLRGAEVPMRHKDIMAAATAAKHTKTTAKSALHSLWKDDAVEKVADGYVLADDTE